MTDAHLSIDVAVGWLLGRAAWAAVDHGILRPFAAAFGSRAYRRIDALTGDRLPNLPSKP
jgi:hypothetical protein